MCGPQKLEPRAIGSLPGPRSALAHPDLDAGVNKPRRRPCCNVAFEYLRGTCVALLLLLVLVGNARTTNAGLVLSEHIRHFEPVFYDSAHLRQHHRRAKRDAAHTLALDFTAHNRDFKIRLRRDTSIFADDVVFESTKGILDFDSGKVYSGSLEDDDLVEVQGLVTKDGLFDGHIATPNELYYLEPADRYFSSPAFHSVMYKASDVLHPLPARCASQQLHLRGRVHNPWVTSPAEDGDYGAFYEPFGEPKVGSPKGSKAPFSPSKSSSSSDSSKETHAKSELSDPNPRPVHPKLKAVKFSTNKLLQPPSDNSQVKWTPSQATGNSHSSSCNHSSSSAFKYSASSSRVSSEHIPSEFSKSNFEAESLLTSGKIQNYRRNKRSIIDPKKTTCMLYLQADHLFYREEGSEEACIDKITRHVQRVNNIYKVTDFDRDGKVDGIGFMIKRIKIHTENATKDPSYRFPGNYGVEKFLELFSEEDYDAFCLAYMFTYRDFEGGTLGLAWTGDLKNAGGVCEKNGHYRGSLKSLNTGIVTLLNYGKKVPPAVSHVTLAHEIGHNFGSPHDPEKDINCTPGGENGNFIMFARATSGDKENNNKFSPCSLKQINSVLNSKARDPKGCFTEPQKAVCGNGVVEEGEECDCGWLEDCEESCCFPMVSNPQRNHKPCTLRPSKICSPSQGPCCTRDCNLKQGDLCREDNGCRDASFCGGSSPYCPPSINKPNKTICKDEFVCFKGECTGSICLAYGLDSCQCKRESGDPETKSCELCCKLPGEDQPCLSSFDWNVPPYNIPDMYAKPGTPCDEYKGYCDVFQKCREVDPSGPLATLRELLLGNESLANLHRWLVEHWYAVFFVILALIVILVTVAKLFGRRSKKIHSSKRTSKKGKKKKKKTIVHKNGASNGHFLTPSGGNPATEGATHVVHPTVVRTNIPFKRKVNEVRRAATKAKRVARSQLGRPYKKPSLAKRTDGGVTSPTESEKSLNNVANAKMTTSPSKSRDKSSISSRFSIIAFKPFKPKPISPDKSKAKVYDKRKSGVPSGRRSKSKSKSHQRSKSPDKKRKSIHESPVEPLDKVRSRSPSKRMSLEDDRRKSKLKPNIPPEKSLRSSSPEKAKKHRPKSPEKNHKLHEGNWLINKFLADEEKIAKPVIVGSLAGSLNGSLNSVNGTANASPVNGSPIISHNRSGSTRALLATTTHASPVRGIVNEAFIGSPRNARTHSSLRVTKSVSPEENLSAHLYPSKYRRSVSMMAYNNSQMAAGQDKRKRSALDEGALDKRRRFSSPEKPIKLFPSPAEEAPFVVKERGKISSTTTGPAVKSQRRRSASSLPSSVSSSNHSFASVPDKIRQKLSLITASPEGSLTSIVMPEDVQDKLSDGAHSRSSQVVPKISPKDWV